MTIKELIWDIKTLLRQLTDDSYVRDAYLIAKLNLYRAYFIKAEQILYQRVDQEWFQRIKKVSCTNVNSADDPNIPFSTVSFGKFTIPRIIELPDMVSLNLRTSSMTEEIYFQDYALLMEMIVNKDNRCKVFKQYTRLGDNYYVYPYIPDIAGSGILYNPLNGYQFATEFVDLSNLSHGIEYTVVSGILTKDPAFLSPTVIRKGETFIADGNSVYTGNGKVKLSDQVIAVTGDYEYPVGGDIAQRIVLEILTKDFQIEQNRIFDTINNSIDDLKLIYSKLGKGFK
jgi:hypothetical protein